MVTTITFFDLERVIMIQNHTDPIVCSAISATVQLIDYLDLLTNFKIIDSGYSLLDFKKKKYYEMSKKYYMDLKQSYPEYIKLEVK